MKKYNFFHLCRADREAVVLLIVLLLSFFILVWYLSSKTDDGGKITEQDKKELDDFQKSVHQSREKYQYEQFKKWHQKYKKETFAFDPNTADSITLLRLGLAPWMVKNALKYRRKGGRWKSPDDFSRLYGLSKKDFERLKPYIRISDNIARYPVQTKRDSFQKKYPEKFKELTLLDLNVSDTSSLKHIPGIGSYYSRKIVDYGKQLGGFVSVNQLKEITNLPRVEQWFIVKTCRIRKLDINRASFQTLVHHPYLNYEQVKAIFDIRHKTGDIKSFQQLNLYPCFSKHDFERLKPYVKF